MVSVIIPCYNHQQFIKKTLDSIKNDEFKEKEVVIINDGSSDNSHEVITKWIKENKNDIKITYKNRENKGLNATLNELISLSKYPYIVLVGSDDYLLDGGIRKRVEYLKNNPSKKAVFSDAILIDKDDNIISNSMLFDFRGYKKEDFKDSKTIKDTLLKRFVLAGPILMVKKEIYDEIGPYDPTLLAEDLDFYLRALAKDYVGFLDTKVCAYRIHEYNQSLTAITPKLLKDSRRSFLKHYKKYPKNYWPLMFWNIFKFFIRENLLRLKLLLKI